jgi:hypothetical protein
MADAPTLAVELVPIEQVETHPRNPKLHALPDIEASMSRHGFVDPLLVDGRTGRLVAGHGRVEALLQRRDSGMPPPEGVVAENGTWMVPVLRGWSSTDDAQAEALMVGLNQLTILGGWDTEMLTKLLDTVNDSTGGLYGVGFSETDLDQLRNLWAELGADDDDTSDWNPGEATDSISLKVLPATFARWQATRADIRPASDDEWVVTLLDGVT